jgi:hypothetical protein
MQHVPKFNIGQMATFHRFSDHITLHFPNLLNNQQQLNKGVYETLFIITKTK